MFKKIRKTITNKLGKKSKEKIFQMIVAAGLLILLVLGAFGQMGWFPNTNVETGKRTGWFGTEVAKTSESSNWNPFAETKSPQAAPQLSKEYIYAGSRLLAIEEAGGSTGSGGNWTPSLIENGSFESFNASTGDPDSWIIVESSGATPPALVSSTDHSSDGTYSLKIGGGATYSAAGVKAIPIDSNKTYTVTAKVRTTATNTGGFYLRMNESNVGLGGKEYVGYVANSERVNRTSLKDLSGTYNGASGTFSNFALTSLDTGNWVTIVAEYVPTAGVQFASLSIYDWGGNAPLYVDSVVVSEGSTGSE